MQTQTAPALTPYPKTKAMDTTTSQGGRTREVEYYEHYRAQGVQLKRKYRRP